MASRKTELSVIIPSLHEAENLAILLPTLVETLDSLTSSYEILVVDRAPDEATKNIARQHGALLLDQKGEGYGSALMTGFARAGGGYLMTMDADLSHSPEFIGPMLKRREEADLVIASRYVRGGRYEMPLVRTVLSKLLNEFFGRGLSLKVKDISSGFRLYRSDLLKSLETKNTDFAILQEILVKAVCEGWTIAEVAFDYRPRKTGRSNAQVFAFGLSYLRTFWELYRLRNSILSADYDDRAYDSVVIPQRYWQRQRYKHVTELVEDEGPVLDVGCGSSKIIGALAKDSVATDVLLRKLRYARRFRTTRVQASGFQLPFATSSFPCVLCSQVIEHVSKEGGFLEELVRVLRPGGAVVLGTPDYARWEWRFVEAIYEKVLPSAYADEHISPYTKKELVEYFEAIGFQLEDVRYILRGELIMKLRKPV